MLRAQSGIPWYRRLEARLLLSVALILALAVTAMLVAVRWVVTSDALARLAQDERRAKVAFDHLIDERAVFAASEIRLITELPIFRAHLTDPQIVANTETINAMAEYYRERLVADFSVVTDAHGKWIGQSGWPDSAEPTALLGAIETARTARSYRAALPLHKRLYLVVAEPAVFADEVLGTLVTGYWLNDAIARDLAQLTNAEVNFLSEARLSGSSLNGLRREEVAPLLTPVPEGDDDFHSIQLPSARFVAHRYALSTDERGREIGSLVLLHDWQPTQNFLDRMRAALVFISASIFLLAVAGTVGFGRRLTRPLQQIAETARDIASGHWDRRVPIRGSDEVALLATAFNEMTASLTHWHSEATYLAERERAREELRKSEERFQLVTKATNDLIWDWDPVTNELWWSEGSAAIFGRVEEHPSVEAWSALIHKDDHDRVKSSLDAFVASGDHFWSAEYRLQRASGAYAWILDRGYMTRDADGKPRRMIGSMMDITERKEAERMKSDFVSFVSHQLRTPLSGVRWMLEVAAEGEGSPEERDGYIAEARASAERLIALVNDLLDISRLESGRLTIVPEPIRLDLMTRDVVQEMTGLIAEHGHRLTIDIPKRPQPVTADQQLLRQVLTNLLSNAIKYTPSGGEITISLTEQQDGVRWSIRDSGIGIPKAAQGRLFEKFYRADNAVSVEIEGTGLGLNLVRLIVEQFKGRIWCESEEGQGATFFVTLPCEPAAQVSATTPPVIQSEAEAIP